MHCTANMRYAANHVGAHLSIWCFIAQRQHILLLLDISYLDI